MNPQSLCHKTPRQIRYLEITPELVLEQLKIPEEGIVVEGRRLTAESDPVPEDARVTRLWITDRGDLAMVVESDSFDEVHDTARVPEMRPTFRMEDCKVYNTNGVDDDGRVEADVPRPPAGDT